MENVMKINKTVVIHFHSLTNSMEVFMKTYTTHTTGILDRWTRFLGAMLMVALMMPAVAFSQYSNPAPVDLGTAGNFVILAQTQITTTGTTHITGDIGISPAAATFIQGFDLILPAGSAFSTSALVTGNVYAPGYADPTSANLTTAVLNMGTAFTTAAGRAPDATELYAGDLTGQTLTRGVYKWTNTVLVSAGGVTISGSATDVWIFQIAQDLTVANGAIVTLGGSALASNIFWQVAGQVTLGTTAVMSGNILCQTQIAMNTGATLNGRALAQTAVTLIANTVNRPTTGTVVENRSVPKEFVLFQNYPNPFNPSTSIPYYLAKSAQVFLKIYNVLGLEVATLVNGRQEAGSYIVQFNPNEGELNLSSGVYFYRLQAGSFVSTKKLILLK
jgi:hypothetical protein